MAIGTRRPRDTAEQRDGVALHAVLQWLAAASDMRQRAPDDAFLARRAGLGIGDVGAYRARAEAGAEGAGLGAILSIHRRSAGRITSTNSSVRRARADSRSRRRVRRRGLGAGLQAQVGPG